MKETLTLNTSIEDATERYSTFLTKNISNVTNTEIDGKQETVCWAWQRPNGGRSFGFSGGHFHDNWARVEYRRLIAQGILWSLDLPVPKEGLPVKVSKEDLKYKTD